MGFKDKINYLVIPLLIMAIGVGISLGIFAVMDMSAEAARLQTVDTSRPGRHRITTDGKYLTRFLDTVGDGTGSSLGNIDGTANHDTYTAANATERMTAVAHGLVTGDGPFFTVSSGADLPDGLLPLTDYWIIRIDDDIFQYAASEADAASSTPVDIADDGTGTHTVLIPSICKITPPSNKIYNITRLLIVIRDNSNITAANYGGVSTLSNGVQVRCMRGNTVLANLTNSHPITGNVEWGTFAFDVEDHTFGSGDNFTLVRWSFFKSGNPLVLDGLRGDSLEVWINDDLSSMTGHTFVIQGTEIDR